MEEELTIGTAQIPFTFFLDGFTETVVHGNGPSLVNFDLSMDGEFGSQIDPVQSLSRNFFAIAIESGGDVLSATGGADCTSTGGPGCISGTFTATIDSFAVDQLAFLGGGAN